MEESPRWPTYHVGGKDSTFALGVISSTYGSLEFAFNAVFVAVTGITSGFASMLLPKLNNDMRIRLLEEALSASGLSPEAQQHVGHFVEGYKSNVHNRNMLMHSQILPGGATKSILIMTQRNGKTVGCSVTLQALRKVGDDMETFRGYGLALGACINWPKLAHIFGIATPTPPPELLTWPGKPPLPNRLEYTSDPIRMSDL
jgi:hypothetical protein